MSITMLLQSAGITSKPLIHRVGWFGNGTIHKLTSYVSNDPATIKRQADLIQASGFAGIVHLWYGPTVSTFLHDSMMKMWRECEERGLLFALMLDPWIARGQANQTQAVVTALQSEDFKLVVGSKSYVPEGYVMEFGLASVGVNVATVQAAFPTMPILSKHTGFSWPETTGTIATLTKDNANVTMRVAGLCLQFMDGGWPLPGGVGSGTSFTGVRDWNTSVWDAAQAKAGAPTVRVIPSQGGQFLSQQLAVTPKNVPYVQFVTLDDYDEGTELEPALTLLNGSVWTTAS